MLRVLPTFAYDCVVKLSLKQKKLDISIITLRYLHPWYTRAIKGHYPTGQYIQTAYITDQHLVMRQTLVRHYALSSTSHCEQTYNLHLVHSGQNIMISENLSEYIEFEV